ncbi:MAG: SDR family oxidoreductase [Candidatus Marinimicrobia bacterium]|jgi:2-dehydro-3-deoxy-D-gluconate 5-dehydrogenase|nr:SDR family oxidoreductase [Candidatus Neomarinimicrobiota bacterium]MBT4035299.1 SDR family oxidoreductase [Candidatus Neomarinimicrobiota bacterium]MBT4359728.1 SDR family oxidoreductase [Candidatus Neomarinimicrobiota bacterium]MBT4713740.1 SDR family oxidoreductase [Candidatus Neomarinimicrobiota bacterium]MBT4946908.1 SDR family oxidoreductase [Candidatus Neomarinimicrobiota bacterium]
MNQNMFSVAGRTALVTGASRGIGLAIAKALVDAGANMLAVSRSGQFSELQKYCELKEKTFFGYTCDLSDRQSVIEFVSTVNSDHKEIDILVNNAGTIKRQPAEEHSDDHWDEVLDVNLRSQFILSREIGKGMLARGRGKIVFIASLLSFQGGITVPGYAASKGGIKTLTMALSNEWAGRGVNINAVAPGYIATDNTAALQADPVRNKAILERIPAGRWGKPSDIAGTVVFLSSPASDYINGTTILVDGGWMGR